MSNKMYIALLRPIFVTATFVHSQTVTVAEFTNWNVLKLKKKKKSKEILIFVYYYMNID